MLDFIDSILDRITMYRLVLYYTMALIAMAAILSLFGAIPYSPLAILYSTGVLLLANWCINKLFAKIFKVHVNAESSLITALILALIISPPQSGEFWSILPLLILASAVAMASKYLVNIRNKHIFNPAAFAVFITALVINRSASWWVGTAAMIPLTIVCGMLMVRKLRQFDLAISFLIAELLMSVVVGSVNGSIGLQLNRALFGSALFFFASVMLTEPLTMPPNRDGRIAYGILVGMLFNPQVHFGSLYFSPELALLVGNVFAYAVSPKGRHVFVIQEVKEAASGVYDFILRAENKLRFKPGQYMEWTLAHVAADSRGNRRYFTLASSPEENNAILGVKFYNNSSSYKQQMLKLKPGDTIVGGQLAGDFVLPEKPEEKLVFVAGGIGVTPFRSMIKHLLDKNEKRDIVVLYANRTANEIAYSEVFAAAHERLGIPTVYTLSDKSKVPAAWPGYTGHINAELIVREIPDYRQRTFYISGSQAMVSAIKKLLSDMGMPRTKIKTDFFPGLV